MIYRLKKREITRITCL